MAFAQRLVASLRGDLGAVRTVGVRALSNDAGAKATRPPLPALPKRPVTGYAAFFRDAYAELAASNPRIALGDAARQLAARWKGMSDDEKKKYIPTTEEEVRQYEQELAAYKEAVQKREDARNALRSEREQKRQQAREPKPRTVSAYSLFYKDVFASIKDELGVTVAGANAGSKLGPVAAAIAAKWKALSEEERQAYKQRAQEATASKQ